MDLIVVAKEPVPGRVKTRLAPPCSVEQAAALAAAALADTLSAAIDSGADRVLLALDGLPGSWIPPGVQVVDQGEGALDRRLARAWSHARGPAVQIGMDTPQVTAAALRDAYSPMVEGRADAVLGPALDGGWWAIGMAEPDPRALLGMPTSRSDTGLRQHNRLRAMGLDVELLPMLRDVDDFADAVAVAAAAPRTAFARCFRSLGLGAA